MLKRMQDFLGIIHQKIRLLRQAACDKMNRTSNKMPYSRHQGGESSMKQNTTVLPPEVLLEEYRLLLADPQIQALPLIVSGNSMSPFLIHGRDTVYLSRLTRPVRRGDILLYQRGNGAYILHRVWKAGDGSYTMVGDAQTALEPGIRDDQIIAIVTAVERKGKRMAPGSFWWEFFEKVWIRMVPLRLPVRAAYTRLTRK